MSAAGDEVHGVLNSADADPALAVPIYIAGSDVVRVLASDEFLDIDSCSLVTAAGGDAYVFFSKDATLLAGHTILRGTFAVNSGLSKDFNRSARSGLKGDAVWAFAPAGAYDVTFTGRIRKL